MRAAARRAGAAHTRALPPPPAELRQKKAMMQTQRVRAITGGMGDVQQLRVCNVCGAKLSSRDSDE